jgi:hypothetical protein
VVQHFILLMDIRVRSAAGADGDQIRNGGARALGLYCLQSFLRRVKAITNKSSLFPNHVSNWVLPEYKSEMLLFDSTYSAKNAFNLQQITGCGI